MKQKSTLFFITLLIIALSPDLFASQRYANQAHPNYFTASRQASVKHDEKISYEYQHLDGIWYDIWDQFKLPHYENAPEVKAQIKWLKQHPTFLTQVLEQSAPYIYYIYQQIQERDLPGELVLLPVIESAYDPYAYSWVGAAGLWQFMPKTAAGFGIKQNWWYDGRRDVTVSTQGALDYLSYLHDFFNDNWLLAIASYDAGEGTLQRAVQRNKANRKNSQFWNLSLPEETKLYVPRLLALATIISNPKAYHVKLPKLKAEPYFAEINLDYQIDLANAASLAEIGLTELYQLNPGYSRWTTAPSGPHRLLIPVSKTELFKSNLLTDANIDIQWKSYAVKESDTLKSISKKFNARPELLKKANHLTMETLKPGQVLSIPTNTHTLPQITVARATHHDRRIPSNAGRTIYVVQPGNTLSGVAHQYHVSQTNLAYWNHFSPNHQLRIGERLVIWEPRKLHYKVNSGDSLSKIAVRYHVKIADLEEWNHLSGKGTIYAGQTLVVG